MNGQEQDVLHGLAKMIARFLQPGLTERIRKDPVAFAVHTAKLELKYLSKSQRVGELRRERNALKGRVHALEMENELLRSQVGGARLRTGGEQLREANLTDPDQAHAAGAHEHAHAAHAE